MADADRQRLGPTAFLTRPATSAELVGSRPKQAEATPDVGNQSARGFAASCPARLPNPSSCPFGGICHSCPAPIQAKLVVGAPNDKYEQEADRIADEVMRMPDPRIQRACPTCDQEDEPVQTKPLADQITPLVQRQTASEEEEEEEPVQAQRDTALQRQTEEPEDEEEEPIQAKRTSGAPTAVLTRTAALIRGFRGGRPLTQSERDFFEPRFGHSFSRTRIHTGKRASLAARTLGARAFTTGRDVVCAAGHAPSAATASRRLLAHELTHVLQHGAIARNHVARYVDAWAPGMSGEHESEARSSSPASSSGELTKALLLTSSHLDELRRHPFVNTRPLDMAVMLHVNRILREAIDESLSTDNPDKGKVIAKAWGKNHELREGYKPNAAEPWGYSILVAADHYLHSRDMVANTWRPSVVWGFAIEGYDGLKLILDALGKLQWLKTGNQEVSQADYWVSSWAHLGAKHGRRDF